MKLEIKQKFYDKSSSSGFKSVVRQDKVLHHYNTGGTHLRQETFASNAEARAAMGALK